MVLSLALGVVVGIMMGLTGAGGGILAVPLLVFGVQLTVAEAGPIGLLAVGISATLGTLIGLKGNIVRYRAALLVAGAGILMAPLGVWVAQRLNTRVMSVLFAAVLAWVAYKTFKDSKAQGISHIVIHISDRLSRRAINLFTFKDLQWDL